MLKNIPAGTSSQFLAKDLRVNTGSAKYLFFWRNVDSSARLATSKLLAIIKLKRGTHHIRLYCNYRIRQITSFLKNALKMPLNIFSNFFFYLKVQSFQLIMENNFIQMAVSAGHAVALYDRSNF